MIAKSTYSVKFQRNNHELIVAGTLRPHDDAELDPLRSCFARAVDDVSGVLYLNFKRLLHLNHAGFVQLARLIREVAKARPDLNIKLIISSVIPWAAPRFMHLAEIWPNVTAEQYDRAFYPGQRVIDNDELIPVLRTQTQLLWNHEKERLVAHGLRPGMRIADICCGLGDFAILVRKTFDPEVVVAVDHARRFLDYAVSVAKEFRLDRVEYRFGDATHLLLPDDSFDFVTSRLSLQVFDRPEQIVRELYRICKPGGRAYVTNEFISQIFGYPHQESIITAFQEVARHSRSLGMDMDFGPKALAYFKDEGFQDIRIERLDINNINTDPDEFAQVVENWTEYVMGEWATATRQPPQEIKRIRAGHEDLMDAIRHRRGFACWPIYVVSGRKAVS